MKEIGRLFNSKHTFVIRPNGRVFLYVAFECVGQMAVCIYLYGYALEMLCKHDDDDRTTQTADSVGTHWVLQIEFPGSTWQSCTKLTDTHTNTQSILLRACIKGWWQSAEGNWILSLQMNLTQIYFIHKLKPKDAIQYLINTSTDMCAASMPGGNRSSRPFTGRTSRYSPPKRTSTTTAIRRRCASSRSSAPMPACTGVALTSRNRRRETGASICPCWVRVVKSFGFLVSCPMAVVQ